MYIHVQCAKITNIDKKKLSVPMNICILISNSLTKGLSFTTECITKTR